MCHLVTELKLSPYESTDVLQDMRMQFNLLQATTLGITKGGHLPQTAQAHLFLQVTGACVTVQCFIMNVVNP